jgi:hypothetical protein
MQALETPLQQTPRPRRASGACLALALAACRVEPGPPPPPIEGPLFAVAATTFLADGATTLIGLVEDPGAAATLDTRDALEVGGAAAVFGTEGDGAFIVGSSDSPVLTRFELTAEGGFTQGPQVSLANTGITSGFKRQGLVPILAEDKAYWLDDITQQVVIWNPRDMVLAGSFSISEVARDGLVFELGERAVLRDDGLLFVGGRYRTPDEGEIGSAVALVIDTEADALVDVLEDTRCGDTVHVVEDESGALFFGTGTLGAVLHALGDRPAGYPEPCILRVLPGEQAFDPGFQISIPSLVGGRSAGRLVAGRSGGAFVLALHEENLEEPLGPNTDTFAPFEATAWLWHGFTLGAADPAALIDEIPLASASGGVLNAGGRDFITLFNFLLGQATLLSATADGRLSPGLTMTGFPFGILQVL